MFLLSLAIAVLVNGTARADIVRFSQVDAGLYRGGQPERSDLDTLKSLGVKTVVNLRQVDDTSIEDERNAVAALGMTFVGFPIHPLSKPSTEYLTQIVRTLHSSERLPVFVHCHAGKDRTGVAVGLYRVWVQGWQPEAAWDEMLRIGFSTVLVGLKQAYWDAATGDAPAIPLLPWFLAQPGSPQVSPRVSSDTRLDAVN